MLKPLRVENDAPWKQRYRAATIAAAQVARSNPTRGMVSSTETGQYQLYAWSVPAGRLRQLTFSPEGVYFGSISPDGRYIYYLRDTGGNEIGHFVRMRWEGGEPEDITPTMPPYSAFGLNLSRAGNLAATVYSDERGFHAITMPLDPSGTVGAPLELHRTHRLMFGPSLSFGGEIAVLTTTERSAFQHNALLAYDVAGRKKIGELWEEGSTLMASSFSPVPGDFRLLAASTRTGFTRPSLWDPLTGQRQNLELPDLPGDVSPGDWSADGRRILLAQSYLATQRFFIYDLVEGALTRLDHPPGLYGLAAPFGPGATLTNGEIMTVWQDSTHPPRLVALDSHTGRKIGTFLPAGDAPAGRPWKSVTFESSDGETVQAWLGVPDGEGPFPTILHMHGGPETQTVEYFMPNSQAWLDHGFAWLAVNYRGSTGFGHAFREKIWGDLGHWELEDVVTARNWLVKEGIADPTRVLLHGWSYGGYLALLALGKYPGLWAAGLAGTATVDWAMEYDDLSAAMKGYSVTILGGTPQEQPERYAAASPMTYVKGINAPVLIIQGRNDTRTPARPVEVFERRMRALGKRIQVHWYEEGHSGGGVEQEIEHQELMMRFAYDALG